MDRIEPAAAMDDGPFARNECGANES